MTTDPFRYFRIEAHDLLDEMRKGSLDLSRGVGASEPVRRLLRAAHTLKSAARVVRLRDLGDRAHAIEDLLVPFRDFASPIPAQASEELRAHLEFISEGLAAIEVRDKSGPTTPEEGTSTATSEAPMRVVRADVADVDDLVDGLGTVHVELTALHKSVEGAERVRRIIELLASQLATARPATRVLADDLRGELAALERRLAAGVERVTREVGQARESAERLRLMPASVLLEALERTALDAARALDRRVTFTARGGDVRLDAHVLGLAQGALVQMIRNAVAHGVESGTERRRLGKPADGAVSIEVVRRASSISFTVRDDGRGVDIEAVRAVARRKGTLGAGLEERSAADLLALLLEGGLSTSANVSAIAGRGVGMDVVRSAAARLGGDVKVRTTSGHGTEIELSVPIVLSALDVLLVVADEQTFAFAAEAVRGARRVQESEITRTTDGEAVVEGGRAIPFAPLTRCLEMQTVSLEGTGASAVLLEVGSERALLGVDRLLGLAHVLLRPLPELAPTDGSVAGVALDLAGDPVMVLDAEHVVARARRAPRQVPAIAARTPVLVVDDSLTTRMLEQSILESAGYEVDLAISGEDALVKVGQRPYALLLVDVEMPGIDGFEVITRLRADPQTRELPAILVTSRDASEDRARGRRVGANDYVVKGEFDQTFLLARIRELVGAR